MNVNAKGDDDRFWRLLAEASSTPSTSPLRSDEALEAFIKANPLTPIEEAEVAGAVDRLRARLTGRKPEAQGAQTPAEPLELMSEAELLVIFRNQGKSSPEIEGRLEVLRKRVREELEKKKAKRPDPPVSEGGP